MAKKSGSNSSRNERRAGRKRAERAREHGLPVHRDAPRRVRASTPQAGSQRDDEAPFSDAPPVRAPKPAGIPTLVKVVGGALVILLGVYLLGRQRDQALTETKPAPELPGASAAAPSPPEPEPELSAAPSAAPAALPVAHATPPGISATPPTKPVVLAPVVPAPVPPKVENPVVAAPKPAARVAPPAAVAVPAAPAARAPTPVTAAAPPPVLPKPPAPTKPADNPY